MGGEIKTTFFFNVFLVDSFPVFGVFVCACIQFSYMILESLFIFLSVTGHDKVMEIIINKNKII
jgi:hypothetical protein